NFFKQSWPANEQIATKSGGIQSFEKQFQQTRVGGQDFEKQSAQSVCFDEPDKLIQGHIRIGDFSQPVEQQRPKLSEYLARAWSNMRRCGRLDQIREQSHSDLFIFEYS